MASIFGVRGRTTNVRRTGRGNRQQQTSGSFRSPGDAYPADGLALGRRCRRTSFLSQTLGSTVELSYNTGSHTYTFDDTEGIAAGTVDPAFTYTQVTGTEATLAPVDFSTQDFTSLSFDQNVENIDYLITSLGTSRRSLILAYPARRHAAVGLLVLRQYRTRSVLDHGARLGCAHDRIRADHDR